MALVMDNATGILRCLEYQFWQPCFTLYRSTNEGGGEVVCPPPAFALSSSSSSSSAGLSGGGGGGGAAIFCGSCSFPTP